MKFLFNLQTETLKIERGESAEQFTFQLPQTSKFSLLGGIGFYLHKQSWIIFKVEREKVKVIYKTFQESESIYYQRELFRPPGGVIEVEFCEWDRVKK